MLSHKTFAILFVLSLLQMCTAAAYEVQKRQIILVPGQKVQLPVDYWEGLILQFDEPVPEDICLFINDVSFKVEKDVHASAAMSQVFTFPAYSEVSILSSQWSGICRAILVHAGSVKVHEERSLNKENSCAKPAVIGPEVWREGLPDPLPERDRNQASHMVIHHSAGSNTNTDYFAVVRSIYLLHLETNGWDDIGYNYLVSGDGKIFVGRDPLEENEEDEVRGAHFCSKNTGTMGVCIIGTYTQNGPSEMALVALKQLLLWKLVKEGIHPMDSFIHPSPNGSFLRAVCGHRDGCATLCPGDSLYARLTDVRNDLIADWIRCTHLLAQQEQGHRAEGITLTPNPIKDELIQLSFSEGLSLSGIRVRLMDMGGRSIPVSRIHDHQWQLNVALTQGLYILQVKTEKGTSYLRLMHD